MNTSQPTKNLVQQVAKQIVQEPWEILKQAGRQTAGTEQTTRPDQSMNGASGSTPASENELLLAQRDKVRSQRLIQALESELQEIKRGKEQQKMMRQQQELAAVEQQTNQLKPLEVVATKPGRKMGNFFGRGQKAQAQRQQTQTERPLPPSG